MPAEPTVAAEVVPEPTRDDDVRDAARPIALANAAVDHHDGAAALAILADHARRHPHGQLREERIAARIFALCETGDETRARAVARSFLDVPGLRRPRAHPHELRRPP